jgi:hypothetical protein
MDHPFETATLGGDLIRRIFELDPEEEFMTAWKMIGYVTVGAVILGLLVNINDIKRYIRISTM